MGNYPKPTRAASIKCIDCNSPVVTTVDNDYICIDCGNSPVKKKGAKPPQVP